MIIALKAFFIIMVGWLTFLLVIYGAWRTWQLIVSSFRRIFQ